MPIKVLMPALSPTMAEGNLVRWHKKEGDTIKAGDLLAEIETDKATMEVEAVDEGQLGRILVPAGTENVKVNSLIALILEEGEDTASLEKIKADNIPSSSGTASPQKAAQPTVASSAPAPVSQSPAAAVPAQPSETAGGRVFASPLAKRMAAQKGINLQQVKGSGPHGRVIKADLEKAPASLSSAPSLQPVGPVVASDGLFPAYEEVKLSNMRKIIAQRLKESKQTVPHFYLTIDCEIDTLLKARQDLNERLEKDAKISVNDFVIRACALALRNVPDANAAWGDSHIKKFRNADIAVAVAIDGGLVTPIIRKAEEKSLFEISKQSKELIQKARAGKLAPEEFQGGTFSLSNLGMYGIREFAAVINPPQGCILAVGAGEERPVVKNGKLEIATVMSCTLSADHRVVDGAVAAEFLKEFKRLISSPILLFA
jgi:pyruvate dehydrogenase E2 component (dihydrolipoamide acetyltransferase)